MHRIDAPDDPRLWPYLNVRDRELAREGDLFIAEGEHLTRRLLASTFPVQSVLVSTRKVEEIAPLAPPHVPVYVAPDSIIHRVLGYKFHAGVISCGRRKPNPTLEEIMAATGASPLTLVVCPELHNVDNVGSLIRIAAAFGVAAMHFGERSCDPFWRRSIRLSMGTIFQIPIVRGDDIARDLRLLRDEWGVQLVATVLDEKAEVLTPQTPRPPRLALLFGSESQGLDRRTLDLCDRRLTIPMRLGTDSLNVAVSAGIFLWHFTGSAKLS